MNVYLDESGDLGWTFDKPYRRGGSSRYLTISFLLIPKELSNRPRKIVKKVYRRRKRSTKNELKGKDLTPQEKIYVAKGTVDLIKRHSAISISAITVKKENVQPHIRTDENKLYNYMIKLALLDRIQRYPVVDFVRDEKTIKVKSGRSLIDYLQTELWLELNAATIIRDHPSRSHTNLNLQFIDFLAHMIWSRFEDNESGPYHVLRPMLDHKFLFF